MAPGEVTQLWSDTGHVIQIDRDPEAGITLRLSLAGEEEAPNDWCVLVVQAVAARPKLYPSSIPFVPNTNALIKGVRNHITVIWRSSQPATCGLPEFELDEEMRHFTEQLLEIKERLERGELTSRAEATEEVKSVVGSMDPATRAQFDKLAEGLRPDDSVLDELDAIFDFVADASLRGGWQVRHLSDKDSPVPLRRMHLEREGRVRRIAMLTVFGPSSSVVLEQDPEDSSSAA